MLGERLRKLRGSRTQQEIADKLGISRARYSHYENEHVQPDTDMLQRMASLHGTSIDYLLGRTTSRTLEEQEQAREELEEYLMNPNSKIDGEPIPQSLRDDLLTYIRMKKALDLKKS